jgi:DNA repair protein RadC
MTHAASLKLAPAPAPADRRERDRWLLMRLLGAASSLPRLADRLLAERGSLGAVLALSDERLLQLGADANGIAILGLLREAIRAVTERSPLAQPRIESSAAVVELLFADIAWRPAEEVRAVFLDATRRLIRVETLGAGTVASAHVHPREIARRALELAASSVILVHNHPSGDPTPSEDDRALTRRLAQALATLDIALLDHVVIARGGWASALAAATPISTVRISTGRACAKAAEAT